MLFPFRVMKDNILKDGGTNGGICIFINLCLSLYVYNSGCNAYYLQIVALVILSTDIKICMFFMKKQFSQLILYELFNFVRKNSHYASCPGEVYFQNNVCNHLVMPFIQILFPLTNCDIGSLKFVFKFRILAYSRSGDINYISGHTLCRRVVLQQRTGSMFVVCGLFAAF